MSNLSVCVNSEWDKIMVWRYFPSFLFQYGIKIWCPMLLFLNKFFKKDSHGSLTHQTHKFMTLSCVPYQTNEGIVNIS